MKIHVRFIQIPLQYFIISLLFFTLFSCGKEDTNAPKVTLNGNDNIYLVLNGLYTEEGATATDTEDGELAVDIEGEVNSGLEGTYELTYSAFDNAGNRGSATRWVHVYNEAMTFSGSYNALSNSNTDTIGFTAIFNTSTTINQRIWIQGYAMDATAIVYADIINNQIIVPKQEFISGGNAHYYSGQGIIYTSDSVLINLSFSDSTSGTIIHGNSSYTKPLPD